MKARSRTRSRSGRSSKLKLTVACWNYERTRALADGRVRPDGIELNSLDLPGEEVRRARADADLHSRVEAPVLGGRAFYGLTQAGGGRNVDPLRPARIAFAGAGSAGPLQNRKREKKPHKEPGASRTTVHGLDLPVRLPPGTAT